MEDLSSHSSMYKFCAWKVAQLQVSDVNVYLEFIEKMGFFYIFEYESSSLHIISNRFYTPTEIIELTGLSGDEIEPAQIDMMGFISMVIDVFDNHKLHQTNCDFCHNRR